MEIKLAGKYRLLQTIGQGGFADVYKCLDLKTNQQRAVKLERRVAGDMLFYESRILQHLKDSPGIPRIYDFGFEGDFNFLVMDYCGFALSSILTLCGGRFSLKVVDELDKTVCQIGISLVTLLEQVHVQAVLHRDVKPENCLFDPETGRFYLIDFGLAKKYLSKQGKHMPRLENKSFRGTLRYCSLNMHLGVENTRRDDLESLIYVLIFFLKGSLPWQNAKVDGLSRNDAIKKIKMGSTIGSLCANIDEGFRELMSYCRNLGFAENPNYDLLRSTLSGILKKNGLA